MRFHRIAAASTVGITTFFLGIGAVGAHVTASPSSAPANGYATVFFQVPHGCAGSATTKIAMQIPEGVTSVKPEAVAGWTATSTTMPLTTPVTINGRDVTTRVSEVSWTGGPLADDQFQRFGVSMKLPNEKAGTELVFPTVQTCVAGTTSWTDIAKPGQAEPDHPAPTITLTAANAEGQHGAAADEMHSDDASSSVLSWIALGASGAATVIAVAAFAVGRRRSPSSQG